MTATTMTATTETRDLPHPARAAKPARGAQVQRSITIETRQIDEDARTVELAFASEAPVERWWGVETLSHDRGAVRMGRLAGGAAVLVNHDSDKQVGVVESARIDGDKRARAVIRFGRSALAEEIWQDVRDGIRSLVSVGYIIHEIVETTPRSGIPEVRVTDWEPLEISIVSVPADASVGVGRDLKEAGNRDEDPTVDNIDTDAQDLRDTDTSPDPSGGDVTSTREVDAGTETRATDRTRIDAEIRRIAKSLPHLRLATKAEDLISVGGTVEDMRQAARMAITTHVTQNVVSDGRSLWVGGSRIEQPMRYKRLHAFKAAGEESAYRSGMWARATIFGDKQAERWLKDAGERVMTGGVFTAGGATVPDEMSQAIIDLRETFGAIRMLARNYPMGSDTALVPRRTGGVTAYFANETVATTESDKSWDGVELIAKELSALSRFSMSLAEDSVIDLAEDLASEMAYAFADKEDDCAFNGDGTSTYGGIVGLRARLLEAGSAGSIVTADSGVDTFAEVDATDLANMRAKLPAYAEAGAVWVISKAGKNTVFDPLLSAAGGNTKADLNGRLVEEYLGDAIAVAQKMPTSVGDLSDLIMFLYGNLRQACTFGDRRGFTVQVLRERYAEFRQIGVIASERFAFNAHDTGSATAAGPVVGFKGN